jgi:hypothetical protein
MLPFLRVCFQGWQLSPPMRYAIIGFTSWRIITVSVISLSFNSDVTLAELRVQKVYLKMTLIKQLEHKHQL